MGKKKEKESKWPAEKKLLAGCCRLKKKKIRIFIRLKHAAY
jgi:hypothetical protein